jgi:hypothetical protein
VRKQLDIWWWRLEWALWKRLIPDDIHRWMAYLMAGALHYVKGPEISELWTWSMTPFPAGFPFLCQYKRGLLMLLGTKKTIKREIEQNEREIDEAMADARRQIQEYEASHKAV